MTTAGSPSSTAPSRMKSTAVRTRKTMFPPGTASIAFRRSCGICSTASTHATTAAVPSRKHTAAVTTALCTRRPGQVLPGDLAVHEDAHDERVDHREHRRLGRRHHAAQDAAEDDGGQPERDHRVDEGAAHRAPRGGLARLDAAAAGVEPDVDHDRQREDHRGHEARREQRGHRHVGDRADDDHQDAGRHQDAHRGGRGDHRHRLLRPVAGAQHRRDHRGADRRDVGHRGAGDPGEDVLGHHHRHREAAPDPPDQHLGQPHETHRDAAGLHEGARQDEEGDGEQHERIHALEDLLHDHGERILPAPPEPDEAGDADRRRRPARPGASRTTKADRDQRDHAATAASPRTRAPEMRQAVENDQGPAHGHRE